MKVNLIIDAWYDGEENTPESVKSFVREAIKLAEDTCGSCSLDIEKCECADEISDKVYVLMEQENAGEVVFPFMYDVMGITYDKDKAENWVSKNSNYRKYKETKELQH